MMVDDEFHLVVMMVEKKTTTIHTTPGLLFKKSMTTDLLQDQIIITIQSVLGPAPEWRGVSRSRGRPGDGSGAGVGAQWQKKNGFKHWI